MSFQIKRIYEPATSDDGLRVLIDRLWPRGLRKEATDIDLWLKEIAPSPALRQWFGHDPGRWPEFRRRYRAELDKMPGEVDDLRLRGGNERVTLLYGAKDEAHNHAIVLKEYLDH